MKYVLCRHSNKPVPVYRILGVSLKLPHSNHFLVPVTVYVCTRGIIGMHFLSSQGSCCFVQMCCCLGGTLGYLHTHFGRLHPLAASTLAAALSRSHPLPQQLSLVATVSRHISFSLPSSFAAAAASVRL